MLRSLYSGVLGLKAHQVRMDIIGNNIANVNTLGFKKSRVTFKDAFYQMLKSGNRSEGDQGGVNPSQVGLGVTLGSVETMHTQGNLQNTGKSTDLAIDGEGMFILKDPRGGWVYTRVGNFDFDAKGFLVNDQGFKVQGYNAVNGSLSSTLGDIVISEYLQPKATTEIKFKNNLDADASPGTTVTLSKEIFDSVGHSHVIDITLVKENTANTWKYTISHADGLGITNLDGYLVFDTNGKIDQTLTSQLNGTTPPQLFNNFSFDPADPDADVVSVYPDFSEVTQFGSDSTIIAFSQDGNASGTLNEITVQTDGTIIGDFEGGVRRIIGQIALASFTNPAGLQNVGNSLYRETENSGEGIPGSPQTLGRGTIVANALEMSNVDLAQEFTDMVVTQRGFQANSRTITISDELLQELVNLKR